jgi:hypothetical protein
MEGRRGRVGMAAAFALAVGSGLFVAARTGSDDVPPVPASTEAASAAPAGTTAATTPTPDTPVGLCDPYGSVRIQEGRYTVQNNRWGATTEQCIAVTTTGFSITSSTHDKATDGSPAGYPSIYEGCHFGACTAGRALPAMYSSLIDVTSDVAITAPDAGEWNAAFDLWFDPTPRTDGQNTGAEVMVWIDHRGRPQPIGAYGATVDLGGTLWDVWTGDVGWKIVSYVRRDPTTELSGSLTAFVGDAIARGLVQDSWYLTSVQFGFEPWVGGAGLGVDHFTVTAPAR